MNKHDQELELHLKPRNTETVSIKIPRVLSLVEEIRCNSFEGTGNPERLRHQDVGKKCAPED